MTRSRLKALALVGLTALAAAPAAASDDGWKEAGREDGITIYNRTRPGSEVKELKAVGVINAPSWACMNVVSDEGRFKEFMPYTADSRVIKDGKFERVVYQRISAPFVAERDYTLKIRDVSTKRADGSVIYKKVWTPANDMGPPVDEDVVRLRIVEGFWQFEDLDGGKKTRVTYYVYTDPGGALPAFIINAANKQAIPGLFETVGKQAKTPRYSRTPPPIPGAEGAPAPVVEPAPAR